MPDDSPKHTRNPLDLVKKQDYYDHCREDVVAVVREQKITASRVIELGCSSGRTGEKLKEVVGAEFYAGIEISEEAVTSARGRLDQVHVADLNQATPADLGLKDPPYDLLVTLDILEHLYDPWSVLARWADVLRPGGRAVLSLPNVQNLEILALLAQGQFPYRDEGVLDATHIRFFTRQGMLDLIRGAGLAPQAIYPIIARGMDISKIVPTGNKVTAGNLAISELSREDAISLFCPQFIIVAQREV